jgi:hypothetical protein
MKTLLQKLTRAGQIGLLSPGLLLLFGSPAQPTPAPVVMGWNLPPACSIMGSDEPAAKKTEQPVSTYTIRQNKENILFTSWIFPTRTPGGSPKIEYRFKKPEPWGILTTASFTNNSKELVYSGYRPYWNFYWTRDTRYKT